MAQDTTKYLTHVNTALVSVSVKFEESAPNGKGNYEAPEEARLFYLSSGIKQPSLREYAEDLSSKLLQASLMTQLSQNEMDLNLYRLCPLPRKFFS